MNYLHLILFSPNEVQRLTSSEFRPKTLVTTPKNINSL